MTVLPPFCLPPAPPPALFIPFKIWGFLLDWVLQDAPPPSSYRGGIPPVLIAHPNQGWGAPFLPTVGDGKGGAVGAEPPVPALGSEYPPPRAPSCRSPPGTEAGGLGARNCCFPFFGGESWGGVQGAASAPAAWVGQRRCTGLFVCVGGGGDTPGWGSGGGGARCLRHFLAVGGGRSRGGSHPSARLTALVGGGGRGGGPAAPPHPPPPAHSSRCFSQAGAAEGVAETRPTPHSGAGGGGWGGY